MSPEQKEKKKAYNKAYHLKNRETINARSAAWAKANPERSNELKKRHRNKKKMIDPIFGQKNWHLSWEMIKAKMLDKYNRT